MFVSPGSLLQIVVALLACLGFMTASAWYQPYVAGAANYFKVATEVTLLVTLTLAVMLRFDLSEEDIDADTVGNLMLFFNVCIPLTALVIGVYFEGIGYDKEETGDDSHQSLDDAEHWTENSFNFGRANKNIKRKLPSWGRSKKEKAVNQSKNISELSLADQDVDAKGDAGSLDFENPINDGDGKMTESFDFEAGGQKQKEKKKGKKRKASKNSTAK
jgi:hypothetical protein